MLRVYLFSTLLICSVFLYCQKACGQAMPESEASHAGPAQVVRWDLLLNQAGADSFKKVAAPVDSQCQSYQAFTANGFELRQAMADANTNGGVIVSGSNMAFAVKAHGMDVAFRQVLTPQYYKDKPQISASAFAMGGAESIVRAKDDHISLNIQIPFQLVQVNLGNKSSQLNGKFAIQYKGELAPGDAVAFLAPYAVAGKDPIYQLTVYETFKAANSMVSLMSLQGNSAWWCANGPGTMRKWTAAAMVWEAGAAHAADDTPDGFTKKLDDGKELKLIGLSRPNVAPWCWWDAAGKPVSGIPAQDEPRFNGEPQNWLVAMFEVKGSPEEEAKLSPATRPMRPVEAVADPYVEYAYLVITPDSKVAEAGSNVGDWREIAQIKLGESATVDGINYKVEPPRGQRGQLTAAQLTISRTGDDLVQLSPVGPDGKEAIPFDSTRDLFFNLKPITNFNEYENFQGFDLNAAQYFRLCARKRQIVTFSNFAHDPLAPVRTDVTPEEIAAAAKTMDARASKDSNQTDAAEIKAFLAHVNGLDAYRPDPTDAMGSLRMLRDAAKKGDEATVRSMLKAESPADEPMLDPFAHLITEDVSNFAKAIDRFGPEKLSAMVQNRAMLGQFSQQILSDTWTKNDDGSYTQGNTRVRKDDSGHYHLFLPPLQGHMTEAKQQVDMMNAMEETVAKVLEQKDATLEQLSEAAAIQMK